tara:strand:+ start:2839 stop:3300 length:462 start_codon:yes stop_codon:yes gene_type:complete
MDALIALLKKAINAVIAWIVQSGDMADVEGGDEGMMKWSDFSSIYSERGFREARKQNLSLEDTGALIHDYWCKAQQIAERDLSNESRLVVDYTAEKAEQHQALLVPYSALDRGDQIKDLYIAYELDKDWFMSQPGADDIIPMFKLHIHWVDWS